MNLSVNDIFDSKDEIIKAMKDFADQNNIKYDLQETPKTISLFCQGKEKFGCDCFITSNYRKKDNKFIVKKMKLIHKCPTSVTDFGSTDDFIKNEIYRAIGDAEVRIGDIVSILHNRGIKVSYNSVWNAMRKKESDYEEERKKESDYYEEKENGEQKKSFEEEEVKRRKVVDRKMDGINEDNGGIKYKGDHNLNDKDHNKNLHDNRDDHNIASYNNITLKKDKYKPLDDSKFKSNFFEDSEILKWDDSDFKKFHDSNEIIAEYAKEFVDINSDKISVHFYGKLFFYYVPEYSKVLFPVCEIKFYKRKNGIVIYGLLYDPLFEPVVYSCLISEDIDDILAFKFFIRSHPKIFFMVEYDDILIEILEECKVDFFIKTRDICNFIYSLDNNKENIENIWNNCNFGNEIIKELVKVNPKRYLKQKLDLEILNINNLPECDVDFIMYSVYSLNYFDCINAIHKLSNDSIKNRKRFTITDTKSLFGNNVITRIERNMNYEISVNNSSNYGCNVNGSGNLNNNNLNNNINHINNNINNINTIQKVDLINQICDCGKFQELMIPCVHACIKIKEEKGDPYNYVSTVYSKEQYNKLIEIIPVLNISLKLHSDKVQIRKGPGRPKKFSIREVDVM